MERQGYKQTFTGSQIWIRSKKDGIAKIHPQDLFHIWILDKSNGCQLMLRLTNKGNVIEYIRQHDATNNLHAKDVED